MTLTMERHHAQSILEGKKIYEARYLTDSGPKQRGRYTTNQLFQHDLTMHSDIFDWLFKGISWDFLYIFGH